MPYEADPYDVVGVGFGPSNLALAVTARETDPTRSLLFLERNAEFSWHPGMLLEGSRMQISFLKDLASMRNLASRYSFLSYLKHRGRLEQFINLAEVFPSRIEYTDYLRWVADEFADQVVYGAEVIGVTPVAQASGYPSSLFEVKLRAGTDGNIRSVRARNLVVATGGSPRIPGNVDLTAVIHSSEFLPQFSERLPDQLAEYHVVVAGDGQSAGEIVLFILENYPNTRIDLLLSGYAPRPVDNSPFVNEHFYSISSREFYDQGQPRRIRQLADVHNANYSAIEDEVLRKIYRIAYLDEVRGRRRLRLHRYAKLTGAAPNGRGTRVVVTDRLEGTHQNITCDLVVLATGYDRRLDRTVFADVLRLATVDHDGDFILSKNYRMQLSPELKAGLYVQGFGERPFGLGDTLLSLLPFRSEQIFDDIVKHIDDDQSSRRESVASYPPDHYLETDQEKMYAVIERFKFATLISARDVDDPVVSQVPLTLDKSRGRKGTLFGHLDRSNPQAELLDGRPVTVLFHGPNSYISPRVYETDQLPTWNSITVVVKGRARVIQDRRRVVSGLCGIAEKSEFPAQATLQPIDRRIGQLIGYIVGFEVEITHLTGRFKLSQDRDDGDRRRAAEALARNAEADLRDFIENILGISLKKVNDAGGDALMNDLTGGEASQ